MKYHVVGGFSFYERAEIKDLVSYLKVIQNPDDSIAMQRVINTPPRGIGKNTMETIERIALETGASLWGQLARRSAQAVCRSAPWSPGELSRSDRRRPCHASGNLRASAWRRRRPRSRRSHRAAERKKKNSTAMDFSADEVRGSTIAPILDLNRFADGTASEASRTKPSERVEGFRAPGDPAVHCRASQVPDRPHWLHQATGSRRHARSAIAHREPARTGERRHGFARPRRDPGRVSRPCCAGQRRRPVRRERAHHPDDAARRQRAGVSAGVPRGLEEGLFPHSRTLLPRTTSKKSAVFAMSE